MMTLAPNHPLDLTRLIDTRLLVQANSGGGKSWCLRRLLEQTHGQVQHLVLDPEGEFASLRSRYDYVLASKQGGDTAADPRSAKLLAERLLELGVSAILDIYELKAHDRIRFVRLFLESLVDAPKKLWHPVLVIVDEAHVFCPQQGEAESAGAVIDLATRGRKRGYCAALATQRLSKLHKDAAAECNNVLIGRSALDVDMKRAADLLGFTGREEQHQLRTLKPGEFFAFGPALSPVVTRLSIGPVVTAHPSAGSRIPFAAPPPTAKVKALLPKLADLPAEVETRERSMADLRAEVTRLRHEAARAKREMPPAPAPKIQRVEVVKPGTVARFERAMQRAEKLAGRYEKLAQDNRHLATMIGAEGSRLAAAFAMAQPVPKPKATTLATFPVRPATVPSAHLSAEVPMRQWSGRLPEGERKILTVIAQHPDGVTRVQISVITGYKRSSRDAYLQRLRAKEAYVEKGERLCLTPKGDELLGYFERLPTGAALLEHWLSRLPEGEAKLLRLIAGHPVAMDRERLSELTGYKRSSRDAYLQRLIARNLVARVGRGAYVAHADLFDA